MARILFIYPNINTRYGFSPAIQMLSAVLKEKGHQTALIHINPENSMPFDKNTTLSRVAAYNADIIGLSATTFEYENSNTIAGWIKEADPTTLVILGGIHATIKPDDLWTSNFDAFCVGEGELPMLELARRIDAHEPIESIPSFWFREIHRQNLVMPFIGNLNTLPFHDFDIIDTEKLLAYRDNWLSISFSRGCPYNCAFCANPLLKKVIKGNSSYFRVRKVALVMEELLSLITKYPQIKVINFDDDLLMIYHDWMNEFCESYREKIFDPHHIEFILNCRVDNLNEEIASKLSRSGCRELKIGVESGDENIRNQILNKKLNDSQIINAFDLTHKYNIRTTAYMIMGVPNETEQTMQKTFEFLGRIQPTLTRVAFLQPYEGTAIYDMCKRLNLIDSNKHVKNWHEESPLVLPTLTPEKLLYYKFLLPWHINVTYGLDYQGAIAKYENIAYNEFIEAIPKIIQEDYELSVQQLKPHFRYFNRNDAYIEFYRPGN
jgi:anaerobic magnesium-protoporphyrin IX monomethyl ester cyclase